MQGDCDPLHQGAGDSASIAAATVRESDRDQPSSLPPYVLITPARNEEAFIEKTIESVIYQTRLTDEMGDRR